MAGYQASLVEITAVSEHQWRVCDVRVPESDDRRVLGYVEERAGGYDVRALGPAPFLAGHYPNWLDAIADLIRNADSGVPTPAAA